MRNNVQDRLRYFIEKNSLNLKQFSIKCEVPYRTLQDYLAGNIVPGGENLIKMNAVFRLSIDWLLAGIEPMYVEKKGADRVADPSLLYLDDETRKVVDMLKNMGIEERRDVLKYLKETQQAAAWRRENKLKEG